jgi:predicted nucleic acid-binding protein
MPEPTRGVLDTSVLIDHDKIDPALLPDESAISDFCCDARRARCRPHATESKDERARRQDRLQWATSTWDPLPFDAECARLYGRMFAAARAAGHSSRARLADLLVASTAAANGLPLYTRNASDFVALKRSPLTEGSGRALSRAAAGAIRLHPGHHQPFALGS